MNTGLATKVWLNLLLCEALAVFAALLVIGAWRLDGNVLASQLAGVDEAERWEAAYTPPSPVPMTAEEMAAWYARTRSIFQIKRTTSVRSAPRTTAPIIGCIAATETVDDDGGRVTGYRAVHGTGWSGWISVADLTGPWRGSLERPSAKLGC